MATGHCLHDFYASSIQYMAKLFIGVPPLEALAVLGMMVVLAMRPRQRRNRGPPVQSSLTVSEKDCGQDVPDAAGQTEAHRLIKLFLWHSERAEVEDMMRVVGQIDQGCRCWLDVTDYVCIIKRLARDGLPGSAHVWLRHALEAGNPPMHNMFIYVISSYAKAKDVERALSLFREMKHAGLEIGTVAYNTIMDACRRVGDVTHVQHWMRKMLAQGVQPNVISFGIVLPACADAGLLGDLQAWFDLSQTSGVQLGFRTLQAVLWSFVRRNDPINAKKWLTIMVDQGERPAHRCCADLFTVIIDAGDVESAVLLLDMLRAADFRPRSGVYSRCVAAAAMSGLGSKAQALADECVAWNGRLSLTAKQAMIQAGLQVPTCGTGGDDGILDTACLGGRRALAGDFLSGPPRG